MKEGVHPVLEYNGTSGPLDGGKTNVLVQV